MSSVADLVLLGTRVNLDAATGAVLAAVALLLFVLGRACLPSLRDSLAARVAFGFVLIGALIQCLAAELLLFLTGGAVLGYAMLALGLAGPRVLTPLHALAVAILLVAGDLALLELMMLLNKSSSGLDYVDAGQVFAEVANGALAQFCLVLGFGSRVALVALCVPEGRSSAANIATLPGWLLLGLCATAGAVRLSCSGGFGASCAQPLLNVLWWVPLLAVIAWQLPRLVPALLRAVRAVGSGSGRAQARLLHWQERTIAAGKRVAVTSQQMESRITGWPAAMGGAVLLVVVCLSLLGIDKA